MKHYDSRHTAALSARGFYTILTVCGLIIAASAWVLWSSVTRAPEAGPAPTAPIIAPAEALPDLTADQPVLSEEPDEPAPADTAGEPAPADAPVVTVSAPVYVRPASGAVITPFSGDELLFQPTLGDWRVHTGTDFAAEAGEPVLALTDGTVQDVFEEALYGTCVSVAHDADLVTTYRGLDGVRVANGQWVSAGESIGACAEKIDAEAALGTHVHVEAARAGTPVNLLELLGEDEAE